MNTPQRTSATDEQPLVSIIIPAYNAAPFIKQCLKAIKESSYSSHETIVVDDGSTDESATIARREGVFVFRLARQSGPTTALHSGAKQANRDILLFVDSDVLLKRNTVARVVSDFQKYPDIAAVFGSDDDSPAEKNFLSQYKNLVHHFVQQHSKAEAVTFWAGCGAIRKATFYVVGGFAAEKYTRPSIEDIELGYRLTTMGYRILLDKHLQVKHLKQWRLRSLLHTHIFSRAVPWTKLILENRMMINDLNLQTSPKISTVLLGLSLIVLLFSIFKAHLLFIILFLLVVILLLNYKLFCFLIRHRGLRFTALSSPCTCFTTSIVGLCSHCVGATTFFLE
jgi:glycosyltransferase involved in cell wall biosynthesis